MSQNLGTWYKIPWLSELDIYALQTVLLKAKREVLNLSNRVEPLLYRQFIEQSLLIRQ